MSHVTQINESCHTYNCESRHTYKCEYISQASGAADTAAVEAVMSRGSLSHVTHMIVGQVTHINVSHVTQSSGANFRAAEGVDPPPENAVFREKKTQRN